MGSLEPFVADKLMVSIGFIGAICSLHLAGFTRGCLLTCDNAGAGDLQPVGFSVITVTIMRPSQPHQLPGREHKGIAGTTG